MWIGRLHAALQKLRHEREGDGGECLHVGRAAAVELAVFLDGGERVGVPLLTVDGHDVGVAGEDDAAGFVGARACRGGLPSCLPRSGCRRGSSPWLAQIGLRRSRSAQGSSRGSWCRTRSGVRAFGGGCRRRPWISLGRQPRRNGVLAVEA